MKLTSKNVETVPSTNFMPLAVIGGISLFAGAIFMKMRKSADTPKDIKEPLV
jgi:hypothetical protein